MAPRWTEDEVKFLRENAGKETLEDMAYALGKSTLAVSQKAYMESISLNTRNSRIKRLKEEVVRLDVARAEKAEEELRQIKRYLYLLVKELSINYDIGITWNEIQEEEEEKKEEEKKPDGFDTSPPIRHRRQKQHVDDENSYELFRNTLRKSPCSLIFLKEVFVKNGFSPKTARTTKNVFVRRGFAVGDERGFFRLTQSGSDLPERLSTYATEGTDKG